MTEVQLHALSIAEGRPSTPKELDRVAKATSDDAARWAFEQWTLRARAATKFSRAGEMLFEREALEQATSEILARYHAGRFPGGVLVADLSAGIGGDTMAIAERGPVLAFERDGARADLLRHNLDIVDPESVVIAGDALALEWSFDYAFADPARRVDGRRTLDPGSFAPDPGVVAQRMRGLALGLIKLSPLLADPYLEGLGVGLEFVGRAGECPEALVHCGRAAEAGRWAVLAESGDRFVAGPMPETGPLDRFLFDAHPCAVRAHALGELARTHGLIGSGTTAGFLTGPREVISPWLRAYEVVEVSPFDRKRLRQRIRELDGRVQEVKVRGHRLDADQERRGLDSGGSRPLTIVIFRAEEGMRAAITVRHGK